MGRGAHLISGKTPSSSAVSPYDESVTNETPETPQPSSPAPDAGHHGFDAVMSSAPAEPTPVEPQPANPEVAAPVEPAQVAPEAPAYVAPEPVVPAQAPVAPEVIQPDPYAQQFAAPEQAPQAYPTEAYPGAVVSPDQGVAYPGAAQPEYVQDPSQQYAAAPQQGYPGAVPDANGGYGAAAYPAPTGPKKPMSKGLLWGLIAGGSALVLLIAAAVVIPQIVRGAEPTPEGMVEEYLTALSEGDSETALKYVDAPFGSDDLLTDDVLAASIAMSPISDIEVGEASGSYSFDVPVTFTLNGESVRREFTVTDYDGMVISDGLLRLYSTVDFDGVDVRLNGAEIPTNAVVFPGMYEFSVEGTDAFEIPEDVATYRIAKDTDTSEIYSVKPQLSQSGIDTFRALVKASFEACLALKTFTTPCGMDVSTTSSSGAVMVDGTITRTLEDPSVLASMEPRYYSGTVVESSEYFSVDITVEGDQNGQRGLYDVWFVDVKSPSVDFAEAEPVVTWK